METYNAVRVTVGTKKVLFDSPTNVEFIGGWVIVETSSTKVAYPEHRVQLVEFLTVD